MSLSYVHEDSNLSEQQLQKMLETYIERIIQRLNLKPDERENLLNKKEEIVEGLRNNYKEKGLQLQQLDDPKFVQKFALTLISAVVEKVPQSNAFDKLIEGLDKLKQLLQGKKPEKDDLKKLLSPQELKQLQEAFQQCKDEFKKLLKPSPDKRPEDETAKKKASMKPKSSKPPEEVANANLFGLLNMYIAGGLPAVVTCFVGNYAGIVDANPEGLYAQIDQANRIDKSRGDPLSLEFLAEMNFEQFEDIEDFDPGLAEFFLQSDEGPGEGLKEEQKQLLRPLPGMRPGGIH